MVRTRSVAECLCTAVAFSGIWAASLSAQDNPLLISGYGNIHFMEHNGLPRLVGSDPNDQFFQLREFSLFLDYAVDDQLTISTEIEAADNGTEMSVTYAYLDYRVNSAFGFRVGKILVPYLSYNENKPSFKQFLMSQPFTAWQGAPINGTPIVVNGFGWSDAGVTFDYTHEFDGAGIFDVKASLINGIGSDSTILDDNTVQFDAGMMQPVVRPRDGFVDNRSATLLKDNNDDIATVVKLSFATEEMPIDFGLSWYRGKWDDAGDQGLDMVGVHFNYFATDWSIKSEFHYAMIDQVAGTNPGGPIINISTGDYEMNAWYLEGSYVPFRWGEDEEQMLRLIVRYDEIDTNNKASFTPFDRTRITVGTEYQFHSNARFRFEVQNHHLRSFYNAPAAYSNAGGKDEVWMYMASVIFWF